MFFGMKVSSWPKGVSAALLVFSGCNRKLEVGGAYMRKTYPTGHGLPFAYARIAVHFAIIHNCIFLLITMAYDILRGSMGC